MRCCPYTLMKMRATTLSHLEHIQYLMQREEEHMLQQEGLLYPYKKLPRISYMEVQERSVSSMIVQHCSWKEEVGKKSNIT